MTWSRRQDSKELEQKDVAREHHKNNHLVYGGVKMYGTPVLNGHVENHGFPHLGVGKCLSRWTVREKQGVSSLGKSICEPWLFIFFLSYVGPQGPGFKRRCHKWWSCVTPVRRVSLLNRVGLVAWMRNVLLIFRPMRFGDIFYPQDESPVVPKFCCTLQFIGNFDNS